MTLREFFARMAPATLDKIARACSLHHAPDRIGAMVEYSRMYSLRIADWRARYPELSRDRGLRN